MFCYRILQSLHRILQVTSHQLQLQQEADKKAQQAAAEEAAKAKKRVVTEDSYGQLVDSQNVNREATDVEARSVTAALSALGVQESEDKHPERYVPLLMHVVTLGTRVSFMHTAHANWCVMLDGQTHDVIWRCCCS